MRERGLGYSLSGSAGLDSSQKDRLRFLKRPLIRRPFKAIDPHTISEGQEVKPGRAIDARPDLI